MAIDTTNHMITLVYVLLDLELKFNRHVYRQVGRHMTAYQLKVVRSCVTSQSTTTAGMHTGSFSKGGGGGELGPHNCHKKFLHIHYVSLFEKFEFPVVSSTTRLTLDSIHVTCSTFPDSWLWPNSAHIM